MKNILLKAHMIGGFINMCFILSFYSILFEFCFFVKKCTIHIDCNQNYRNSRKSKNTKKKMNYSEELLVNEMDILRIRVPFSVFE